MKLSRLTRLSFRARHRAWAVTSRVRLAEAGAQVAAGDVNEAGLAETAVAKGPGKIHTRKLDVADEADVAPSSGGRTAPWAASMASSTTRASCATAFS